MSHGSAVTPAERGPVLLYDGACGFCARSVQFVLRHDRRRTLRFAPLQGAFARRTIATRADLRGIDSVVWVEPGDEGQPARVACRSDAALQVLAYLGGWWSVLRVARLVPRAIRDGAYDLVARHRHRLSVASCLLPPADQRDRFLD